MRRAHYKPVSWAYFEITRTDSIKNSEALYEDDSFSERELAALLSSKVYYQLGEYDESMQFALGAGKLFNLDKPSEYENTIISTFNTTFLGDKIGMTLTDHL